MESTFRKAVFGGFNRQDVTDYISRMAAEHRERLEQLEKDLASLRAQLDGKADLEQAMEELRRNYENTAQELEEERVAKEQYRRQLADSASQMEKLGHFQRQAEEYSGVKEHIADIELEARRRADGMLAEAKAQSAAMVAEAERSVRDLRSCTANELQELYVQYQQLTAAFQTAAAHVSEELRRMDVAAGQLPLSFDKTRSKLEKLKGSIARETE